jgi:hypothetical protein
MVVLMAMVAFSVDVGYMCTARAQLQRAVDAAALAGCGELVNGIDAAEAAAKEYLVRNPVGTTVVIDEDVLANAMIEFDAAHSDDYEFVSGSWNPGTGQLNEGVPLPDALRVSMTYNNLPFFFARVLGKDTFSLHGQATAMFQPRDIMVVLDYSASMNDDSTFAAIGKLPQATVEQSLLNCWNDLGPPVYGNLPATPTWATAHGAAENIPLQIPHVSVEYRFSSVVVTSTQPLIQVKIEFSNGNQQTWAPGGVTGTFTGSGVNAGKQVRKVWVNSWNNVATFGANGEYFNFTSAGINATLKNALGLTSVAYPYPGAGSWDGYIDYVEASGSENANAGYRYKFGGMNLMEYWLTNYPENSKTPDHWKCRAQPVYALKDATGVFMDFISAIDTSDRVGLVIYNATNGEAILESQMTNDLDVIDNIVDHRQAGHYHQYTNTGAGFTLARQTMDTTARANAFKMIVLMTDGLANWHNGQYDLAGAHQQIIDEANLCAGESRKYKVMTVSLGVGADTDTMQEVADIGQGKHFNVPGGSTYQEMHQQLYAAFEEIAKARPHRLVK